MKRLEHFVSQLRQRKGGAFFIPGFDPKDGGLAAKCLFLLEAPGPKAVELVSQENKDGTARNFSELRRQAGLDRRSILIWNIVPWYVGDGQRIRSPRQAELREGLASLGELLALLPNLEVVILLGRWAARAKSFLEGRGIRVYATWHPAPRSLDPHPERRPEILAVFRMVQKEIR
jgi:uracil-DNA glycosylase